MDTRARPRQPAREPSPDGPLGCCSPWGRTQPARRGARVSAVLQTAPEDEAAERPTPGDVGHRSWPTFGWLTAILAAQVALAMRPGLSATAFDDEGTYIYFGHFSIEHLLHGATVPGYPGTYFSGSPWLYPTLAALGDDIGGLAGARAVSLLFSLIATVATFGIGKQLIGSRAGLLGAAAFVLNGSVIYLSHFATYDSMAMCFVALAACLMVYVAQHDRSRWLPAVAALLTVGFLAKYAVAVYVPFVGLLALATGWSRSRWRALAQAAAVVAMTAALGFAVIEWWNQNLIAGIRYTTTGRTALAPASRGVISREILFWVGAWLTVAVIGALLRPSRWRLSAVLLVAAVVGPLEQLRIGENLSLNKHVAFGLVFASPLIGDALARAITRLRVVGAAVVALALAGSALAGLHYSTQFLTAWPDDHLLTPVLSRAVKADPGRLILGDYFAPQRYELANITTPGQWVDTYYFSYDGLLGEPAYVAGIQRGAFAVIYLDSATAYSQFVKAYLTTHHTPYHLVDTPEQIGHGGSNAGTWFVYTRTDPKAEGS